MGSFKMAVGSAEIVALTDMNFVFPMPLAELWPDAPAKAWEPFRQRYPNTLAGDKMRIEIGCYLVRSQGRTILIDTGYGEGPIESAGGLRGQLMADLASKRVRPEEVDTVFLSHLHLDHVGWNTSVKGSKTVATFPRARYICHRADWDYFLRPDVQARQSYPYMDQTMVALEKLGVLDIVSKDYDLTSEIRAYHTPGHTPGHMSVLVSSQGQKALIEGDVLVHPAQVTHDTWNCKYDGDFATANVTRKKLLDQVEADGSVVVACHFPLPGFGRVVRIRGRRYWQVGV